MNYPSSADAESPERFIGCCGAYCRSCMAFSEGVCKGCKIGYASRERDITKARCAMKLCCFREHILETCADCPDYSSCKTIHEFYNKRGFKYRKYKQAIEFIRKKGYPAFLKQANSWTGPYGRLKS